MKRSAGIGSRKKKLVEAKTVSRGGLLNNALLALVVIVFACVFFAVALSLLDNVTKIVVCLASLVASGYAIHRFAGVDNYYGVMLVKGEAGFGLMRRVAQRFERECAWLADWGLAIGFGLPYAWFARRLQKRSKREFAWQAGAAVAFAAVTFLAQPGIAANGGAAFLFALTLAAGLFGFAFYFLAEHAWKILTVAQTPPGVVPVVPGVTIPFEAIFALIVIAVVHETAHGVMCEIARLRLKSSGVMLLGWLPIGAFVEPDEEAFAKLRLREKRRILIAGSASNALFFVLFLALTFACSLALQSLVADVEVESSRYAALLPDGSELASVDGAVVRSSSDLNSALAAAAPACASCASRSLSVEFKNASSDVTEKVFVPPTALVVRDLQPDSPSAGVLRAGDVVYSIDGASVSDIAGLKAVLSARAPGDEILVESSYAPEGKKMVLGSAPGDAGKAFVGAVFAQEQSFAGRDVPIAGSEALFSLVSLLFVVLYYAFALNFILAAVNLLPLFITDGQRVLYEELRAALGKKTAARASIALGLIGLALLVINALPWVL